jgi:protein-tyrosine phosphatase
MSQDYTSLAIIDLHSHLVPGVDDGTSSIEESVTALKDLYRQGVRALVTTPHLLMPRLADDSEIELELELHRQSFDELQAVCAGRPDLPSIALGQEIWAPDAAAIARVLRHDVGLAGKTLLIEFGFELQGSHNDVVHAVIEAGRQILIAHPERYTYLPGHDPVSVMRGWQELGALLQVNVGSLTGHYARSSPGSEQLAWEMAEQGLIDVLGTDHHGPRRTGVSPREALEVLIARGERGLAERAMVDIPGRILRNETVVSRLPR